MEPSFMGVFISFLQSNGNLRVYISVSLSFLVSIFLSVSNYLSLAISLSFLSLSLIVYGSANTTVMFMNGTSKFPGVAQSIH